MIAVIGDTHFGASASDIHIQSYMRKFFSDFFSYIDTHQIKHVIQLGDLFDVRKHVNTLTLKFFREVFLQPVIERNLQVVVLVGNHDIYHRESVSVSSVEEVLHPFTEWFTVVNSPKDVSIEGKTFLCVPWVCKENESDVAKAITKSSSKFCVGHFEFNGFELFKGQLAKTHFNHLDYKKFERVISGHYHHMSGRDNVLYTGTPYELTWNDHGTPKGFFVITNSDIVFVENKHKLFSMITLSDNPVIDSASIKDKHVKVRIDTQITPKERDALIDKIYGFGPHTVKLIELKTDVATVDNVVYNDTSSIHDLIADYATTVQVSPDVNRDRLKTVLTTMYLEASNAN